jgi:hypothetical protein
MPSSVATSERRRRTVEVSGAVRTPWCRCGICCRALGRWSRVRPSDLDGVVFLIAVVGRFVTGCVGTKDIRGGMARDGTPYAAAHRPPFRSAP